ncbi:mRNA interferase YafQ [Candidatus Bartonella washoeensis]|uniref:YafQ family addiction module toxin component n=1 Tax=Candidatus Bartonella washoeensis Sb944nv TaxID=1094563 RepID=J0PYP0_9HYPH|nr:type II toxin-antitoxin system YafQ family toxin [Bartonella washoeensis]EJF77821.1 YafQ family addiction module toxin component [Bartonella washoeensis Sb944nv]SPU27862.1 mRNA interferase YafQ [Bartonella washoeensis]
MREIVYTRSFRRDLKRESRGRYATALEEDLLLVVKALAEDKPLEAHWRDHVLTGQWRNCRDCHIKPDLVLIYRKPDAKTLELLRLGSHSELRL